MKLFLLKRYVSEYTAHDILLGCFTTRNKAQNAYQQYIMQYNSGEKEDPWKNQAFHEVDLARDVTIIDDLPVVDVSKNNKEVYIISHFSEGFGQTRREFYAICGTSESKTAKKHECHEKIGKQLFPHFIKVDQIELDQLLPDDTQIEKWY